MSSLHSRMCVWFFATRLHVTGFLAIIVKFRGFGCWAFVFDFLLSGFGVYVLFFGIWTLVFGLSAFGFWSKS